MPAGKLTVELEITAGAALHKRRRVDGSAFLIGTSPECDLVLSADGLPEICAIVTVRANAVAICDVSEAPTVTVNGQTVDRVQLANGDTLGIGRFVFAVHIRPARVATSPVAKAQDVLDSHRWTHDGEVVETDALSAAAWLRADIRVAMAKEPRTLRRPA